MQITASAISLNVDDVTAAHSSSNTSASAKKCQTASYRSPGRTLGSTIFLRTGLATFKPAHMRGHRADGLLIAFVVDDDREYARLQAERVSINRDRN